MLHYRPSRTAALLGAALMVFTSAQGLQADDDESEPHDDEAQSVVHGRPADPSKPWRIAQGGRIYDNWWEALDRDEPEGTHPSYPASAEQSGEVTWRCKECHGWDYKGAAGIYRKGSHYSGIVGIEDAIGKPVGEIAALMREPLHGYTAEMITDAELENLALFVSEGQVDMAAFIDLETRAVIAGNPERGREVFQTICATCHGFDGKLLDWGEGDESAYIGTEAADLPDEVLNKILNAHPGVQMVNLRAFPLQDSIDVLSYAATLPTQ
jgi:hypothetical protein